MNAIKLYRLGHWFYKNRLFFAAKLVRNIIFLLFNSYIPSSARIGNGTVFAYGAIGVVIHADAKIGENCVIGQGVTIGASEGYVSSERNKCPIIGDNCYLGAGTKIIGDITIGDSCQIGAGAIVISDIPNNSVVVGIPARIVGKTSLTYRAIRN